MIKYLLIVVLLFGALTAPPKINSKISQCNRFKTGKYFYNAKLGSRVVRFNFNRTDSTQMEMTDKNENLAEYTIKWIDSCVYEMKLKRQIQQITPTELELKKKFIFTTKILSSTNEYYLFQSKSNLYNIIIEDTIWVQN